MMEQNSNYIYKFLPLSYKLVIFSYNWVEIFNFLLRNGSKSEVFIKEQKYVKFLLKSYKCVQFSHNLTELFNFLFGKTKIYSFLLNICKFQMISQTFLLFQIRTLGD